MFRVRSWDNGTHCTFHNIPMYCKYLCRILKHDINGMTRTLSLLWYELIASISLRDHQVKFRTVRSHKPEHVTPYCETRLRQWSPSSTLSEGCISKISLREKIWLSWVPVLAPGWICNTFTNKWFLGPHFRNDPIAISAQFWSPDPDQPISLHKRRSRSACRIKKIWNQAVYC